MSPDPIDSRRARFAATECVDRDHPRRAELEVFVRAVYSQRFDARLGPLMPRLLAFDDDERLLVAAVGLRRGTEGPLFVERYLGQAAEARLQRELGVEVRREQIVELGNFAAGSPGATRELIHRLIPLLRDAGMRWVMFVATRQLHNAFIRLGLAPRLLQAARPECLGDDAAAWGRYYEARPEVVYGDLERVELEGARLPMRTPAAPLSTPAGDWALCEPAR